MNKLRVEKRANPLPKPAAKDLVFGHFFSDHMLECDWTQVCPSCIVFPFCGGLFRFGRGKDGKIFELSPFIILTCLLRQSVYTMRVQCSRA